MNKIESLKELLNQTKADLEEKGFYLDGNAGLERIADMKQYEIAFQSCIEKVWPDEAWWKVTKYWDIFQCILAGNTADEVIEEIIAHIDPSMSESTVEDDDFNDELEYNEEYINEEDEELDEAKKPENQSKSETGIMKKLRSIKVEAVEDDEWEEYDDDFDGYNTEDNFDFDDVETDVADVDSESEEFVYMTVETNKGNADIQDIDYSDIYDGEICVTFKDYDMANYSLGIFEDPEMDVESEEEVEAELAKLEAPLKVKSLDKNDDVKYINFNEEQVEQIKQDIRENLGFGYDDEEFDDSLEEGIFDKFKKNKSKITTKAFGYDKNLKFPGPGASKEQDLKTNLNYWEACREAAAYPKSGKVKWTGMNNQGWVVEYDENESMDLIAWEDFADEHPMPKPSSTQPGPQQNQAQRVDNKTDIRLKY